MINNSSVATLVKATSGKEPEPRGQDTEGHYFSLLWQAVTYTVIYKLYSLMTNS
jgi:hypothetical protein